MRRILKYLQVRHADAFVIAGDFNSDPTLAHIRDCTRTSKRRAT